MSVVQAHQSEIAKVWPTLQDGDTLALLDRFDGWRPSARTFGTKRLAIDGSQAILSNVYANGTTMLDGIDWHDLHIEGGAGISRGVRIDRGANMSFTNVQQDGKGVEGVGLWLGTIDVLVISRLVSVGFFRAFTLGSTTNFKVSGYDLSGMGSDGFNITNCQDGLLDDGYMHDQAPVVGSHRDGGQLVSQLGAPRCARITIQNQRVTGDTQGINLFNNVSTGQQGGEDIAILDSDISINHPWAVCLQDVLRGRIENVNVSTLPGSPAQAVIGVEYHDPSAPMTVERWNNICAAYGSKPAIIDPPRLAPQPSIADLMAAVEADEVKEAADIAALKAAIGKANP